MAQEFTQEATTTFIKGLITEAGELTFPKDASVDELNCDLLRDGSRRRRLGLAYEGSYELSDEVVSDDDLVHVDYWRNVGNESGVEFVVVQVGSEVYFYEQGDVLSAGRVKENDASSTDYVINLSTYEKPTSTGAETATITCASINGALVIVSAEIEPILVERDISDGSFSVSQITVKIRDFGWAGDPADYVSEGAASPSYERRYDTLNCGWVTQVGAFALGDYVAARSAYPPLILPWYSGKDSSDNFSVTEWRKVMSGNTLITNGHYIVEALNIDREAAASPWTPGIAGKKDDGRFTAVASYAGRVFYSGVEDSTFQNSNKVFFSQLILDDLATVGHCYQRNDPTSEILNDLLDTDGGVVTIPDAYNIKRLHVFGATLYVFAENGVWALSGVDDVFRATEYSISRITEQGLGPRHSFVSANGRPYWWSYQGIYTLGASNNSITAQNISLPTVQTFWEAIDPDARNKVRGVYDGIKDRVVWMYPDNDETIATKYNNFLLLDQTLGAFFPWSIGDAETDTSSVIGLSYHVGTSSGTVQDNVVDSGGAQVTDSGGNTFVERPARTFSSSSIKLLIRDGVTNKMTFAEFTNSSFLDWGSVNFSSYVESAYDFMGDLTTFKNAPYITTYMKTTETGWSGNANDGYEAVRPSSCKMSAFWDFNSRASSTAQQLYRMKYVPTPSSSVWDYPTQVITSRLKVRGRGRSLRLRFESEEGKDLHLLGYEVIGARNGRF